MNNFYFVTPEQYIKENGESDHTLKELQKIAAQKEYDCENCDELAWRLVGCGLCFSCTTGEADASEDYEIISFAK